MSSKKEDVDLPGALRDPEFARTWVKEYLTNWPCYLPPKCIVLAEFGALEAAELTYDESVRAAHEIFDAEIRWAQQERAIFHPDLERWPLH